MQARWIKAGGALLVFGAAPLLFSDGNTQPSPVSVEDLLRVVVPCPRGSAGDALARTLAKTLAETSGRHVVVENAEPSHGSQNSDSTTIRLAPFDAAPGSPCGE